MQEKSEKIANSGSWGEKKAVDYLKNNNFRIIKKNYRTKLGEIDVIATKNKVLYFFEVKTRGRSSLINPIEAVTPSKIMKIKRAANYFLLKNSKMSSMPCSFGVIGVNYEKGLSKIECILDAFE